MPASTAHARTIAAATKTIRAAFEDGQTGTLDCSGEHDVRAAVVALTDAGLLRTSDDTGEVEHPCKVRFCMECGTDLTHEHRTPGGRP